MFNFSDVIIGIFSDIIFCYLVVIVKISAVSYTFSVGSRVK